MYDTIIIGAGMSGLAAGIRLAHYDRRVCILERHSAIGGLNSFFGRGGRTYDVGLHAVTNYAPRGTRQGPLARLLRQLRLAWDEFSLSPQVGSAIMFPGVTLEFSNDLEVLESEIARHFPAQADNFRRFVAALTDYDQFDRPEAGQSARAVVGSLITDPLLVEMLLCPVLFYGGSREHDMDFGQFSILFRSIFLEGLARPLAGIRLILKRLLRKFCDLGGELRCAPEWRGSSSRTAGPIASSSKMAANCNPRTSSPRPACWRPCGCATRRPRRRGPPTDCRSSSRSRSSTGSRAPWATAAP